VISLGVGIRTSGGVARVERVGVRLKSFSTKLITLFAGVCAIALPATALPPGVPVTLTASKGEGPHQFGYAVDIDGDTVVVGAWKDDEVAPDAGATYIFRWAGAGWVQEAKLVASDAADGDQFGSSVSIDGNTVVVGAPMDDDLAGADQGTAYVFTRSGTTWFERVKLTASDAAFDDGFGTSVSIDGGTVLVGSPGVKIGFSNDAGAAYAFVGAGSNWTEQAILNASAVGAGHALGRAVHLDGDTAIVGAPGAHGAALNSGAAYIFTREGDTWSEEGKVFAANGVAGEGFANSVALQGDTALVGAPRDDEIADDAGAVYVFTRQGASWSEHAKLFAADADVDDFFGTSVAIDSETALVGAYFDDFEFATQAGAAYVFQGSGANWTQKAKLTSAQRLSTSRFGFSVAIDGDTAIAGAYLASLNGLDAGSAHVFSRIGGIWIGQDARLLAEDGVEEDRFGSAAAIDGDTVLIGAAGNDDRANNAGAVYVMIRDGSNWRLQAKLTASDAAAGDRFGNAVALDGDTAIIGAAGVDIAGFEDGAVYVFTRTGNVWSEQEKLSPPSPVGVERFGFAVDVDGDLAVVGAPGGRDIVLGEAVPAVYVFVRNGTAWSELRKWPYIGEHAFPTFGRAVAIGGGMIFTSDPEGSSDVIHSEGWVAGRPCTRESCAGGGWTFTAVDGHDGDDFGKSIAFDGKYLAIGAPGAASGRVYMYSFDGVGWSFDSKLSASDQSSTNSFGRHVAFGDDVLAVAVEGADELGSVYLFSRRRDAWIERQKIGVPDSVVADAVTDGGIAISAGTLVITASGHEGPAGPGQGSVWFQTVLDQSLPPMVVNDEQGSVHTSIEEALVSAEPGEALIASPRAFSEGGAIDLGGLGLSISATHDLQVPYSRPMTVTAGTVISYPAGREAMFYGSLDMGPGSLLRSPEGNTPAVMAGELIMSFATITADTLISKFAQTNVDGAALFNGGVTNHGTVHLGGAAMFVTESLDTGGVINDEPNGSGAAELRVDGNLVMRADSEITLSAEGGLVGTKGDFDVAITDHNRFDLSQTELRLDGTFPQALEVMSTDVGSDLIGLNGTLPGHYPIGTLRIGPAGTTVFLVDNHDNDGLGQSEGEAIYVNALVLDAGAALNTNDFHVYYKMLTVAGTVDNPAMLIEIGPAAPGDCDVNGAVDLADFESFPTCLTGPGGVLDGGCGCLDLDDDGHVTIADFAAFQVEFTGDRN